jgi:hypothetical protein
MLCDIQMVVEFQKPIQDSEVENHSQARKETGIVQYRTLAERKSI